ncbi:hypothetical protein [Neptuniibacter sp. QD37_11]|uniref:hypothetical protein n=1 Tax=Neptuniibacter sp. QD37_11 TaxID=3398209 RepID=UPI0039F52C75
MSDNLSYTLINVEGSDILFRATNTLFNDKPALLLEYEDDDAAPAITFVPSENCAYVSRHGEFFEKDVAAIIVAGQQAEYLVEIAVQLNHKSVMLVENESDLTSWVINEIRSVHGAKPQWDEGGLQNVARALFAVPAGKLDIPKVKAVLDEVGILALDRDNNSARAFDVQHILHILANR